MLNILSLEKTFSMAILAEETVLLRALAAAARREIANR
jgi:hypothetical protein